MVELYEEVKSVVDDEVFLSESVGLYLGLTVLTELDPLIHA